MNELTNALSKQSPTMDSPRISAALSLPYLHKLGLLVESDSFSKHAAAGDPLDDVWTGPLSIDRFRRLPSDPPAKALDLETLFVNFATKSTFVHGSVSAVRPVSDFPCRSPRLADVQHIHRSFPSSTLGSCSSEILLSGTRARTSTFSSIPRSG